VRILSRCMLHVSLTSNLLRVIPKLWHVWRLKYLQPHFKIIREQNLKRTFVFHNHRISLITDVCISASRSDCSRVINRKWGQKQAFWPFVYRLGNWQDVTHTKSKEPSAETWCVRKTCDSVWSFANLLEIKDVRFWCKNEIKQLHNLKFLF